jgi:DNA (cytosine-5)-methyltransferase 1
MEKLKVLSLFSGIGAFEEALGNLGVQYELINYCEFDQIPAKAYSLIHNVPEDMNLGDITKVDETKLKNFNLMTYGFPCQDISALGDMKGLTDENGNLTRSGLFFEAMRIAKYKKPEFMLAENVRMLASKKFSKDLAAMLKLIDDIGYNSYWKVLNSKDYGIPHSRNRIYIVSIRKDIDDGTFEFPTPVPLTKKASDYYDSFASEDHYLRESDMQYLSEFRLKKKYSSLNSDVIVCQTTKQGNLANPQNFIKDKIGYRIMTSRELLALQGFKKEYADKLLANGITKEKIGKLSGNSITVKVLEYIFKNLLKSNYMNTIDLDTTYSASNE